MIVLFHHLLCSSLQLPAHYFGLLVPNNKLRTAAVSSQPSNKPVVGVVSPSTRWQRAGVNQCKTNIIKAKRPVAHAQINTSKLNSHETGERSHHKSKETLKHTDWSWLSSRWLVWISVLSFIIFFHIYVLFFVTITSFSCPTFGLLALLKSLN